MDFKRAEQRRIVSELLSEVGYKVMSMHAKNLESKEVLKGYACLVSYEAKKRGEKLLLQRLEDCGIFN